MYKKILVPLDGSEFSECALDHVRAVASGCKAEKIILLYILEPIYQESTLRGILGEEFVKKSEMEAKNFTVNYLNKKSGELQNIGIKVETVVKEGIPADIILDYVKSENIDLVIMTTHGRSGIAKWAFGSVTEKVIRHVTAPILVVAPKACRAS